MSEVVLIDDDALVGKAIRRELMRAGLSVRLVTDPLEAEQVIAEEQPRAVVSDLRMPNLDGLGVLEIAKRVLPLARRVLFSGSLEGVCDVRLAAVSPVRCFEKPGDVALLVKEIVRG